MNDVTRQCAENLLVREAWLLDRREWRAWLDLYLPDAVYWIPAWRDEADQTDDPDREVSLVYHDARVGLEERVTRLRSRQSVTAMPLPRTTHLVSGVWVEHAADEVISAHASWTVHVYDPRTTVQKVHHGSYDVTLRAVGGEWRIARKTIRLQNDCVAAVLDFYLV